MEYDLIILVHRVALAASLRRQEHVSFAFWELENKGARVYGIRTMRQAKCPLEGRLTDTCVCPSENIPGES